jgi:hypothetical protein
MGLRPCPLAEVEKSGQAGQGEHGGGDEQGDGDEIGFTQSTPLRPRHVGQAGAQSGQPAQIAQAPAPTGYPPQGMAAGQLREEGGDQDLPHAVAEVGQDEQAGGQQPVARPGPGQARREQHAADGGEGEQALLGGVGVGVGAHCGCRHHDQGIRHRKGCRPGKGRPWLIAGHHGNEIGVEDRGDDHRGVARVGEVVHGPGPYLASGDIAGKVAAHDSH